MPFPPRGTNPALTSVGHQLGNGKISSRLLADSVITAILVNGWIAAANCVEPETPIVATVLSVCVSSTEIVLLTELTVSRVPVFGFTASEVGLMPTEAGVAGPVEGLNE